MPQILMTNEEYLKGNFAKALEETFVEIDYLLLSDEGYEKMTEIILEIKLIEGLYLISSISSL